MEKVQYRACIVITDVIEGTFRERPYCEMGLEFLTDKRWIRKLVFFYIIVNGLSPQYLCRYLNLNNSSTYITSSSNLNKIKGILTRTKQLKYSLFPFCINEWNTLDNLITKSVNGKCFKSMLMKFFSLQERSLFSIHDPTVVKLLARLRLKFSHSKENKFRHNLKDTVVPMCDCGTETETTEHFFFCK